MSAVTLDGGPGGEVDPVVGFDDEGEHYAAAALPEALQLLAGAAVTLAKNLWCWS